jgi:hypothetical protein
MRAVLVLFFAIILALVSSSWSSTLLCSAAQAKYSLSNHRDICSRAFDAILSEKGESDGPSGAHIVRADYESRKNNKNKKSTNSGFWSKMGSRIVSVIDHIKDPLSSRVIDSVGSGLDFLFGRKEKAASVLASSHSFSEFVERVNIRLGVTFPDVPLPGNEPVSLQSSLRELSLRLFSGRHILSPSITGLHQMASSHEGDRQYWHAMTADVNRETNGQVKTAIIVFLKSLYLDSRLVSEEKQWWFYGRMLHTIQDSYSDAHCARDTSHPSMPIHFFQDYRKQTMSDHSVSDQNPIEFREKLHDLSKHFQNSDFTVRKHKLYAKAFEMTKEFFRLVWTPTTAANGNWPAIEKLLDRVFVFDSLEWENAPAGGSLPEFAADKANARDREQKVYGNEAFNPFSTVLPFLMDDKRPVTAYAMWPVSLTIKSISMTGARSGDWHSKNDPFLLIRAGSGKVFQSQEATPQRYRTRRRVLQPDREGSTYSDYDWELHHTFECHLGDDLSISVYDSDNVLSAPSKDDGDLLGTSLVNVNDFHQLISQMRTRESIAEGEVSITTPMIYNAKAQGQLQIRAHIFIKDSLGLAHIEKQRDERIANLRKKYPKKPLPAPAVPHDEVQAEPDASKAPKTLSKDI